MATVAASAAGFADTSVGGINADKKPLAIVTGEIGRIALTVLDNVDTPVDFVGAALINCKDELITCTLVRMLPMLEMDIYDDAPRLLSATCIRVGLRRSAEVISAIFIEIAEKLTGRPKQRAGGSVKGV